MRVSFLLFALAAALAAKDPTECEVCIASLNTIKEKAKNKKDHLSIEDAVDNYCAKPPSDKENKLVSLHVTPKKECLLETASVVLLVCVAMASLLLACAAVFEDSYCFGLFGLSVAMMRRAPRHLASLLLLLLRLFAPCSATSSTPLSARSRSP